MEKVPLFVLLILQFNLYFTSIQLESPALKHLEIMFRQNGNKTCCNYVQNLCFDFLDPVCDGGSLWGEGVSRSLCHTCQPVFSIWFLLLLWTLNTEHWASKCDNIRWATHKLVSFFVWDPRINWDVSVWCVRRVSQLHRWVSGQDCFGFCVLWTRSAMVKYIMENAALAGQQMWVHGWFSDEKIGQSKNWSSNTSRDGWHRDQPWTCRYWGKICRLLVCVDLLALLRFSAKTAEVALKLMHDVETNPGPNCSGVGNF